MDQRLRLSELVPLGFKVDRVTIEGTDIVIAIRHRNTGGFARLAGERPDGFTVDTVAASLRGG